MRSFLLTGWGEVGGHAGGEEFCGFGISGLMIEQLRFNNGSEQPSDKVEDLADRIGRIHVRLGRVL